MNKLLQKPISICGKAPDWYKGLQYKKLAPNYEFFIKYQKDHDKEAYTKCFQEQILANKVPQFVLSELKELSNSDSIALICYEKPDNFCHRHLVADWFNKSGILCYEWTP